MSNRIFTQRDADTWDALVTAGADSGDGWSVTMSNKELGAVLGLDRRRASGRALRLVAFGMIEAEYTEVNGLPQSKRYRVTDAWAGRSPRVGDYYEVP